LPLFLFPSPECCVSLKWGKRRNIVAPFNAKGAARRGSQWHLAKAASLLNCPPRRSSPANPQASQSGYSSVNPQEKRCGPPEWDRFPHRCYYRIHVTNKSALKRTIQTSSGLPRRIARAGTLAAQKPDSSAADFSNRQSRSHANSISDIFFASQEVCASTAAEPGKLKCRV
jgi:hypothetical protein